jgi:AcrR family transcriptional regulator
MDVREALLEAAITVFGEAGVRGATTRRIAQEAGVNEVTLFRHFKSKDDLLEAALADYVKRIETHALPGAPADPRAELLEWCRLHYRELYKRRAFVRKAMGEREEHPAHCAKGMQASVRIADELAEYLTRLKRAGMTRGDWDVRAAANVLLGAIFADAMGRDTMPARYPYSMRDAVEHYVDLLLAAIGAHTMTRPVRGRTAS